MNYYLDGSHIATASFVGNSFVTDCGTAGTTCAFYGSFTNSRFFQGQGKGLRVWNALEISSTDVAFWKNLDDPAVSSG